MHFKNLKTHDRPLGEAVVGESPGDAIKNLGEQDHVAVSRRVVQRVVAVGQVRLLWVVRIFHLSFLF